MNGYPTPYISLANYSCIQYVFSICVFCQVVIVSVSGFVDMSSCGRARGMAERRETDGGGVLSWLVDHVMEAIDYCGCSIVQTLVAIVYGFYRRLTWFNMMVFILKYVPTGLYVYKTLKSLYITSRERIKNKEMEIRELQVQIQIVDTKLCVREAEFLERTEELRRNAKQLRALRARVRDIIAADDALSRALRHAGETAPVGVVAEGGDSANLFTDEDDCHFVMMLLKELKNGEEVVNSELDKFEPTAEEKEPTSDCSDADSKKEYRVKIIKVTNVYRVASLKHYIKQKRLRRATQQAVLKKKIESIRKLLESWQKSLNAAVYNKSPLSPIPVDLASQEAMGDYSKSNLREFSDSDSELKTSCNDMYYDEYNLNWSQNSFYNVENDEHEQTDIFESSEYHHNQELNYPQAQGIMHSPMCECNAGGGSVLFILPEETSSQVAIEEIN